MSTSAFLRVFPPPSFLRIKYAGLDISDDAMHCLHYSGSNRDLKVHSFARIDFPAGLMEGGDAKDPEAFQNILNKFAAEHRINYAKIGIPEEKAYLFQTEVPNVDIHSIRQNIEFKLEENVPLAAEDAAFYFDILPLASKVDVLYASVSVVPKTYVQNRVDTFRKAGIFPIGFEVVPKSIARAMISGHDAKTRMVVHIMDHKTGIYILIGNVVCFTSTIIWGHQTARNSVGIIDVQILTKELNRISLFWTSREVFCSPVEEIILVGKGVSEYESLIQNDLSGNVIPVQTGTTWKNVFNIEKYLPPISYADSLDYVVASGLALHQWDY